MTQNSKHTITWLHLSDLHYCDPRDGWDAKAVLGALVEDLGRMEDRHGLLPDLVFFTGDIAFGNMKKKKGWNLADQYAGAAGFLDSIRCAFSSEIPKTNLFLVPGNHDVNRKSVNPALTAYLDGIDKENEITEMIKAGELPWQDNFRRLSEYKAFLKKYGYAHLLEDPNRLVYAIERQIGEKTVGIGGFNSVWSCSRPSGDEKGKLWMGANWQSRTVFSKIKTADVRIALAHHPEGWFKEPEKQYFRRIQEGFHFFLHGHEHDNWVTQIANHHATVSAGACYERSGKRDGYTFVRLDFASDFVEIWPREYSDKGSGGWTHAQLPDKLDDDGAWRIHVFQWTKKKQKNRLGAKPEAGNEIKVFISYAREDYDTAKRLYDDLKVAGVSPWMDQENLLVGQNWKEGVLQAIRESDYFLAVISSGAIEKKGYYQTELNRALNVLKEHPPDKIYILPVRINDCLPKHEMLRDLNWADLFPSYENGLAKLIRVFKNLKGL